MSPNWIAIKDRIPTEADGMPVIGYGTDEKLVLIRREVGDKVHLCRWDADFFHRSEYHKFTHWLPIA